MIPILGMIGFKWCVCVLYGLCAVSVMYGSGIKRSAGAVFVSTRDN